MSRMILIGAIAIALMVPQLAAAVPTCTVAAGANLSFGIVVPLASTGDITSNSGGSFWINCSADVLSAPAIYSASAREMRNGGNSLPFLLSATSPGGLDLPRASPGTSLTIANTGSNEPVILYGKLRAADFKGIASGSYSTVVWLTVEY